MSIDLCILIKGAGEMATGVAWRLFQSRFRLVMTETVRPLAVRRAVSFCEAIYDGHKTVEGVTAQQVQRLDQLDATWAQERIPLLVDPTLSLLPRLKPQVLVEATLNKRNAGLSLHDAPLVIALGPGFQAGRDAHFVVETNRGHNLGRLYTSGEAEANTGVPGNIAGRTWERVLRAPTDGVFESNLSLGDMVQAGQEVGRVGGRPVQAQLAGMLRGLIRPGAPVRKGLKLGDVDPRGDASYLHSISDKALALGGSVLEAILHVYNR